VVGVVGSEHRPFLELRLAVQLERCLSRRCEWYNSGITAEYACPRKIRTSRQLGRRPILCAVCRQPFRSDTEPDPDPDPDE
jgi:hypothetical protein